jgi:hypothetical protein
MGYSRGVIVVGQMMIRLVMMGLMGGNGGLLTMGANGAYERLPKQNVSSMVVVFIQAGGNYQWLWFSLRYIEGGMVQKYHQWLWFSVMIRKRVVRIHAIPDDSISDPFTDHDCYHDRHNVSQSPSQFKHDHNQRYCHACDSTQSRGSSDHSVETWSHT